MLQNLALENQGEGSMESFLGLLKGLQNLNLEISDGVYSNYLKQCKQFVVIL